jgi:uncharacterized membrane-anchored protein
MKITMKRWLDHTGGRIYNRLLAIVLGSCGVAAIGVGLVIMLAGKILFSSVWLVCGILFGLVAHRLWRSRSTLRQTFDGHS